MSCDRPGIHLWSMMRIALIAGLIAMSIGAIAQKPEVRVSDAALAAVHNAYPGIRDVEWAAEGEDFEAEFEHERKEMAMVIGRDGTVKEKRVEIGCDALPRGVHEVVATSFNGKRIRKAFRVTYGDGSTLFAVLIGRGEEGRMLLFDDQGRYVRTKMKEQEDEDDND